LKQNLKHQVGIYEAANDTAKSIKAILYFTESELTRVQAVLKELDLLGRRDVVLIDACNHNKPSASNVCM
jgi:aspartate/tyrosine/aromatic aminotransferase